MEIPWRIHYAAERLKEGYRVNRITVRDFLRHFGAERRGATKVEEIQSILDSLDLQTEPDFVTAWIDEPIRLRLKGSVPPQEIAAEHTDSLAAQDFVLDSTPSAVEQAVEQSETAPYSAEAGAPRESGDPDTSDPTFRIGRLPAANKILVTVNENDDVSRAITLMLQYDFSQLPVMQGEREVKGVITWKSIGLRKAFGSTCDRVGDVQERATIVDSDRALFDSIPLIVDNGYVLVRHPDRRITGVVTASDLSLQFQALSEPFLLLREIELHIRQIIKDKVAADDLSLLDLHLPTRRPLQDVTDLTMGEYVSLFEHPKIWQKINLSIDRVVVTKLLADVTKVRNEVMHFDPDPMTADDLAILKRAVHLMRELYTIAP